MRDEFVGICRFSFLGKCDWVETRPAFGGAPEILAGRIPKLYSDARLARRFEAFETFCLPSIKAQTDQDFSIWILTSPELPDRWLERLMALCADVPQIQIILSYERSPMDALRQPLAAAAEKAGRPVIQFRIDDDDAFSRHHVARLRRHARRFADMPAFAISFPRGLVLGSFEDEPISYWRTHQSFIGAGAAVRMRGPGRCIYAINHFQLPKHFPAFTGIDGIGYVRTRWDEGDSADDMTERWPRWYQPIQAGEFQDSLIEDFPFLHGVDLSFMQKKGAA